MRTEGNNEANHGDRWDLFWVLAPGVLFAAVITIPVLWVYGFAVAWINWRFVACMPLATTVMIAFAERRGWVDRLLGD